MPLVRVVPAAEADIEYALHYTRYKFGEQKYEQYITLIEEALADLTENPTVGRRQPSIAPGAWIYPIAKPGRRARHLLLYEIEPDGSVSVYALAYDAMDLARLWPRSR